MHFNMKRYLHGVSGRRLWLLLILLPPLVYLALSAIRSDRFSVKQNISISKESPVALAVTPVGLKRMGDIISHPDDFFQNNFTLRKLYNNLYAVTPVDQADRQFRILMKTVKNDISLTMPAENVMRITYHGKDQKMGKTLVGYYSERLVQKTREGLARSKLRDSKGQLPKLMGGMEVGKHHALWRSERLTPLVVVFIASSIAVLAFLAVLEWADPSFKSERQVARYLGFPILGSLPDLNKISAVLGTTRSN